MQTSDIISLCALVFTVISIIYTISVDIRNRRIVKTQDALNVKLLAKEIAEESMKDKADVNASFFRNIKDTWTLKIYNKGTAIARNVNWRIVGEDPGWMFHNNVFPMEMLNPSQSIDIHVSVFLNTKQKAKIEITWEDNVSKDNRFESWINI